MSERPLFRSHLISLLILLPAFGCEPGYEVKGVYKPVQFSRARIEEMQRDLLKIEDLKTGSQSDVATAGRRLSGHIKLMYENGTVVYEGPMVVFYGFEWGFGLPVWTADQLENHLADGMIGKGIDGMAVGGRRRFKIPGKVCGPLSRTIFEPGGPFPGCPLFGPGRYRALQVRDDVPIIVDFTLEESCIPVLMRMGSVMLGYDWLVCRR